MLVLQGYPGIIDDMEEKERRSQAFGIVADRRYMDHKTGTHIETPERLAVIYDMLETEGLTDETIAISPRHASKEELSLNHSPDYIRMLRNFGAGYLDADTVVSSKSYETSLLAVGGCLEMADAIMSGNISGGFALIRPPGHHAEYGKAMGFCLFNNIAITARYLLKKYGLKRVAIFDWDLHHGNGTERSFYGESEVLYLSIHQSPCYPGTGNYLDVGEGDGEGFTVNLPVPEGAGDREYVLAMKELFIPVISAYSPDIILVSAGFDPHMLDPLGGMKVTADGFGIMGGLLMELADKVCESKIAFFLEGGYSLEGLRDSVRKVLQNAILEDHAVCSPAGGGRNIDSVLKTAKAVHKRYWSVLDPG